MTIELVKILEAAESYDKEFSQWMEWEREDKEDGNTAGAALYGDLAREAMAKCDAMLEAYEILTGKHLTAFTYTEELALA